MVMYMATTNVIPGLALGWNVSTRRSFVEEKICLFIATSPYFGVLQLKQKFQVVCELGGARPKPGRVPN